MRISPWLLDSKIQGHQIISRLDKIFELAASEMHHRPGPDSEITEQLKSGEADSRHVLTLAEMDLPSRLDSR